MSPLSPLSAFFSRSSLLSSLSPLLSTLLAPPPCRRLAVSSLLARSSIPSLNSLLPPSPSILLRSLQSLLPQMPPSPQLRPVFLLRCSRLTYLGTLSASPSSLSCLLPSPSSSDSSSLRPHNMAPSSLLPCQSPESPRPTPSGLPPFLKLQSTSW